MKRMIVIYSFENIDPIRRKQFHRKLFGSLEKTHGGKYVSEIKGILYNIPFERPVNSVIITDKKIKLKIEELLNSFNAKYQIFEIK